MARTENEDAAAFTDRESRPDASVGEPDVVDAATVRVSFGNRALAIATHVLRDLALGFAIVAISFALLLTPIVTRELANRYSDETGTGMTHAQIVETARAIYAFSLGADATFPIAEQDSPTTIGQDAVDHLLQCRDLFWGGISAAAVSVAVCACIIAWLVRIRARRALGGMLLAGGIVALAVVLLALVVVATADFDVLFNWLHGLFFAKDSWFFPDDCLLIRALPLPFWEGAGMLWGASIGVLAGASIVMGSLLMVRSRSAAALER